MAEQAAYTFFATRGVAESFQLLARIGLLARERGLADVAREAGAIYDDMLAEIQQTAEKLAAETDATIVRKMLETRSRNRPFTGAMETHVRSIPGPLGTIYVALLDELDKVVNPRGAYGPFWFVQEYGTGAAEDGFDIPEQAGRYIHGTFDPSGEPPRASEAGGGVGRDLAFIPGGDGAGPGEIHEELPARHFLRDGSDEALTRYLAAMNAIQEKYRQRARALIADLERSPARARTVKLRLEA